MVDDRRVVIFMDNANNANDVQNVNNTAHWSIAWGVELLPQQAISCIDTPCTHDTHTAIATLEHLFGFSPCTFAPLLENTGIEAQSDPLPDSDDHFMINEDFSALFALEEFVILV